MIVRQDVETGVWYVETNSSFEDRFMLDTGASEDSEPGSGLDEASGADVVDFITGLQCVNPNSISIGGAIFSELYSGQNCSYGGWYGLNDSSYCSPSNGSIQWSEVFNANLFIGAALPLLFPPVIPLQVGAGLATGIVLNFADELARRASDRIIVNIGEIMMP